MTPYTKQIVELHKIHKAIENCGCNKDEQGGESNSLFKHYPIAFIAFDEMNGNWIWDNGHSDNLAVFKNDIKDISALHEYIGTPYIIFLYSKDTIFDDGELILRGVQEFLLPVKYKGDDIYSTNISSVSLQDGEDTYICDYYYD